MNKNKELKTVSNYAREKGVSVQSVYKWIALGKVKSEEIDGVKFIIVEKDGIAY